MIRFAQRSLPVIAGLLLFPIMGCSGDEGRAQGSAAAEVPSDPQVVSSRADLARTRGDSAAPLRILEVSDFECPYCRRFHQETWPTVEDLYVEAGLAQYRWFAFPNPNHPRAWPAIEAAFCAGATGRFWPMHHRLFEEQDAWSSSANPTDLFEEYAAEIGIDGESFRGCLREDRAAPLIIRDYGSVARAGIEGTPFFVVNGEVSIQGAQSVDRFRAVLDSLLREQGVEPPGG